MSRIFADLFAHSYQSNQSALMTRCGTDSHHQYGHFCGELQTSFSRNATRAGSEEGWLFSQASDAVLRRQLQNTHCIYFQEKKNRSFRKVLHSLSGLISEDKMLSGKSRLEPFLSPNTQRGRTEIRPGKVKQLMLRNCSGLEIPRFRDSPFHHSTIPPFPAFPAPSKAISSYFGSNIMVITTLHKQLPDSRRNDISASWYFTRHNICYLKHFSFTNRDLASFYKTQRRLYLD